MIEGIQGVSQIQYMPSGLFGKAFSCSAHLSGLQADPQVRVSHFVSGDITVTADMMV